jgi:hypothetical protein
VTPVTIAVFLLGLMVIVIASIFVAAPLFRPLLAAPVVDERDQRERWERQKRQALAAIKEAELDHQMGKLTDEDLAAMRGRFETQALEAMAALEKGSTR